MDTQPQGTSAPLLDRETLLQSARERTGLSDFGDLWFLEPMDRFIAASNLEGSLTPAGNAMQTEVIVKGLASRLRMMEDIRQHHFPAVAGQRSWHDRLALV